MFIQRIAVTSILSSLLLPLASSAAFSSIPGRRRSLSPAILVSPGGVQHFFTRCAEIALNSVSATTRTAAEYDVVKEEQTLKKGYLGEADSRVVIIHQPPIHYTVPNMKLAYVDETSGDWFDEGGIRLDGPPRNYWRQSLDERSYKKDMDVLEAALLGSHKEVDTKVAELEKTCGIRYPTMSRKLLGTWAPILHANKKVVFSDDDCCPTDTDTRKSIECSVLIEIQRSNGPKYSPPNHYGTFFAPLQEGEEIICRSSDFSIDEKFLISKENDVTIVLGRERVGMLDPPIRFGRITYLSNYLLVQRHLDGKVDLWLRADDSYMGKH